VKTHREIVGDGGSDVVRQVVEQRSRIERALAGVRRIVAVGSGKGGVGKSSLTYQIASVLARDGARVAILDADLNGPSQARLAGIGDAPPVPLAGERGALALPRDRAGIRVATMGSFVGEACPVEFDSVARGDAHTWRATRELAFLGQLVATVRWGELDWLLVDLPPGTERTLHHVELLGPRAAVVLVTVPSGVSAGVVTRTVAALARSGRDPVGYVLNMAGYHCASCDRVGPLFPDSGLDLGIPCLGSVPFDPRLAERSDRGLAAEDGSPAATAVRGVASRLVQAIPAAAPERAPALEGP
jgi:ATP-binding protein involved in chromosome partitioning